MPWRRIKLDYALVQHLVQKHDGGLVATTIAVVGSRKKRQHPIGMLPLISLHDELMRSHNELQAIFVVECLCDVLPKRVASSTGRDAPAITVVGVRPH